jgi:hypothetical protein
MVFRADIITGANTLCPHIIKSGHFACLQASLPLVGQFDVDALRMAAQFGDAECFQFVHTYVSNECRDDALYICDTIVEFNNPELLLLAISLKYPVSFTTACCAAACGSLPCLKIVCDQCAFTRQDIVNICSSAVFNSRVECVEYLLDKEFAIAQEMFDYACDINNAQLMKFFEDILFRCAN